MISKENKDLKNKIFIIDGSSFLYRAYYSIPDLKIDQNTSVNAVYGFCKIIKNLIDKYNPKYMLLVWDSPGKTIRHEIYPEYKQNRQAPPGNLFEQKDIIMDFANKIELKQLSINGIEADDLMVSTAKKFINQDNKIISTLVTCDKDLAQALNSRIIILDPFKDQIISVDNFHEKLDISIEKLPFYYALIGDSSDNIKGVKGIGPKTAKNIISDYSSLDDLYKNIDNIKSPRIKDLLIKNKSDAYLSQELFTLKDYNLEEYNIKLDKENCIFSADNWTKAIDFFKQYKFNSFLKNLNSNNIADNNIITKVENKYEFKAITNHKQLLEICSLIEKHKAFALDTETTGIQLFTNEMVGISIAFQVGTAYYIPFGHISNLEINNSDNKKEQLGRDLVLNTLKPYLENSNIKKYLHNAKFDMAVFNNYNIKLSGIVFDTIIAAHLLSSALLGDNQKLGLKALSDYLFNETMINFEDIVKKKNHKNFSYVDIDLATKYAAADAHQTLKLYQLFEPEIKKLDMNNLFYNLEMPLITILGEIERNGIMLDVNITQDINKKVSQEIQNVYNDIVSKLDEKYSQINLNSPKQLEDLLFYHLNLPAIKKTTQKTAYSTDYEVLKELSKLHEIPKLIIKYRELFKLKSTYLEKLHKHINPKTNRIHTSFSQISAATGRLASSEPNLQNIPVDGFLIRSAFKPKNNYKFISLDYSQIELKVLAYLSRDKDLINAFINNHDIHTITASGLFDQNQEDITDEQRQFGKRINFGILYGLTAHGLSKELNISHTDANNYIKKFMHQYKELTAWIDQIIEKTKKNGYVETLFKRRRYLPGINEKNKNIYELSKRIAINTLVQGTAAEIVKIGMLNLHKAIKEYNLDANIILQIHDELILEVHKNDIDKTQKIAKTILESVVSWDFDLSVSTKVGNDWQEVT